MPTKKSKTLRKSMNEHNAAILDGKTILFEQMTWQLQASYESLTADAATVQPSIAAQTQPSCRAVTSLWKIETKKAVKGEIRAEPHEPTSRDWCIINVGSTQ